MDISTVYKSLMLKRAANDEWSGQTFSTEKGFENKPKLNPNSSYTPEWDQRKSNAKNWLKTKLYNTGKTLLHVGTDLPVVRDIYKEFNPNDEGVESLLEWTKPDKPVGSWRQAIHANKYVDPSNVENIPYRRGGLTEYETYAKGQRKANPRWQLKPSFGDYDINLPEGSRLTAMALKEATNPRFSDLYAEGYTQKEIAGMLLSQYRAGLVDVLGRGDPNFKADSINSYTNVTGDQWNEWKKRMAEHSLNTYNSLPGQLAVGKSEAEQDALRDYYLKAYNNLWDKSDKAPAMVNPMMAGPAFDYIAPYGIDKMTGLPHQSNLAAYSSLPSYGEWRKATADGAMPDYFVPASTLWHGDQSLPPLRTKKTKRKKLITRATLADLVEQSRSNRVRQS